MIGEERLDLEAEPDAGTPAAVKAGKLPPPVNRFDREITGGSLLQVLDWKTGKNRTALLAVVTRPSLLYDRLFRTVGQSATFILGVLVVIVVLFGVIELLALIIGVRLTRTITRSVAALYRGTQHVNRGDFSHRIEIRSEDQLAALESSFNSMTASLRAAAAGAKRKAAAGKRAGDRAGSAGAIVPAAVRRGSGAGTARHLPPRPHRQRRLLRFPAAGGRTRWRWRWATSAARVFQRRC